MRVNPTKLSAYDHPNTRAPARELDGDREAILSWIGLSQAPPMA